jgi:hypothetical protein
MVDGDESAIAIIPFSDKSANELAFISDTIALERENRSSRQLSFTPIRLRDCIASTDLEPTVSYPIAVAVANMNRCGTCEVLDPDGALCTRNAAPGTRTLSTPLMRETVCPRQDHAVELQSSREQSSLQNSTTQ